MSSRLDKAIKDFIQIIREAGNKGTSPLDAQAEVLRIDEDGTAWVHLPGGVDETPVKLTINAKVGDKVYVRLSGGRAWITGNQTAPPTDDKTAIIAKSLANIAGNRAKTAQRVADQSQIAAENAQASADNAQADIDSIKKRVVIGDDSVDIVDSTGKLLASYGDVKIELGKNAVSSIIEMCGGMARVSARYGGLTTIYSNNGGYQTTLDYDFNETTFKSKVGNNYGFYEFIYSSGVWECSYSGNNAGYVQVNLSAYGITLKTTSVNEYAGITINYWNGSEATFINADTTKPSRKLILGLAESGTSDNADYANIEIERSKEGSVEHSKINLLTVHDGANVAGIYLDNGNIELNASGEVLINQHGLTGAETKTLLWENARPTSVFGEQDIGVSNIDNFDFIEVFYRFNINENGNGNASTKAISGNAISMQYGFGSSENWERKITVNSNTSLHFEVAVIQTVRIDNSYIIPLKIYGVKEV